jgi:putative transposase
LSKDDNSLAHTRWNCKYHIIFTPKYRRKNIYGELKQAIGRILRRLCELKEVEIIEAHAMPDHIHMLVKIPPKMSVSRFMGCLKGRSAVIIHEKCRFEINYEDRNFGYQDTRLAPFGGIKLITNFYSLW